MCSYRWHGCTVKKFYKKKCPRLQITCWRRTAGLWDGQLIHLGYTRQNLVLNVNDNPAGSHADVASCFRRRRRRRRKPTVTADPMGMWATNTHEIWGKWVGDMAMTRQQGASSWLRTDGKFNRPTQDFVWGKCTKPPAVWDVQWKL